MFASHMLYSHLFQVGAVNFPTVECIHVCVHSCQFFFLVSQLGEVMVSMASNLMLADERVLWMAQREAMACSRIITCLQKIAVYRLAAAQAFSLVRPVNDTMGLPDRYVDKSAVRVPKTYRTSSCPIKTGPPSHITL